MSQLVGLCICPLSVHMHAEPVGVAGDREGPVERSAQYAMLCLEAAAHIHNVR